MLFKSVIGQELVRDQLIRSVREQRVSHALLFHGPDGCGKFPLAMAFAQYLNCENPGPEDSCGVCPSCLKAMKNIHPDINFSFPVVNGLKGKGEPVSDLFIDEWRQFLDVTPYPELGSWLRFIKVENKQAGIFKKEADSIMRKLQLKAFESDHKILLVWLPEKMNSTTANKLLKIIEEPPDKTYFLLVAQSTENILPTILSRTQLVRVNKIQDMSLSRALQDQFPESGNLVENVTRLADGNYVKALKLIESDEQNQVYFQNFVLWMRMSYSFRINEVLDWIPKVVDLGREKQKEFLMFCLRMIRGNFHMNRSLHGMIRLSKEEEAFSAKFNQFINPDNIEGLNLLFSEAVSQISMNANPRIVFLDMSTQLYRLLRTKKDPAKK